jgi:hypothetical protein
MIIQTEIINLEDLVPTNHLYRKFTKLIDLDLHLILIKPLKMGRLPWMILVLSMVLLI